MTPRRSGPKLIDKTEDYTFYVITLPGCRLRASRIRDSLHNLGVPYRIIYGTDALSAGALTGVPYDPRLSGSPGIVGCAWSHYRVACEILKSGKPAFVIEDDALLTADKDEIEDAVKELPENFDIAFLHASSWEQYKPSASGHTESFYHVKQLSHGTQFYYLSVAGATKVVREMLPITDHVDMWYRTRTNWNKYQHKTGLAIHDYDNNSVRGDDRIPKIIHQIWVGTRPLPEKFQRYMKTWALLNDHQGYRTTLWTDQLLEQEFPSEWRLVRGQKCPIVSDVMRMCILQKYGGIYADTDFECLRPIHALVKNADLIWGEEKPGITSTGFIAAIPGLSVFQTFKKIAFERIAHNLPLPVCSGPPAFAAAITQHAPRWNEVTDPKGHIISVPALKASRLPAQLIYPYYLGEPWKRELHPQAYAVHHWAASWVTK